MNLDYLPLEVKPLEVGSWDRRREIWGQLFASCPGMQFYLKGMLEAYYAQDPSEVVSRWEGGAPRPVQRKHALADESMNLVLFGKLSGTGKTTAAFERIWREVAPSHGLFKPDRFLPVAMTGHSFARRVAANAKDLEAFMNSMLDPDHLLIDDLDKRGTSEGKYSGIVQQTLFDLIEARSTRDKGTILTLNSNGNELLAKFDDDIGPYLLRRLRERFTSINFDPALPLEAVNV